MAIKLCVVLFLFVCNAFCKTFVHGNDTLELSSDDYAPFNVTQVDDGRDVIYSNGEDGEELLSFKPQQNYMANLCKQKRVLHDRNAILVSLSANNRVPTINPCVFGVESASFPTYMFVVTFRSMKLSTKSNNVCVKTRLDLFDGQSFSHQISDSSGLCGTSTHHSSYETSRNFLTMRFGYTSQAVNVHENFQAVITPFHLGKCRHDEFKCANKKCVQSNMLCDGYNNCGDNSDEKHCGAIALSIAAIVGIVVGGVFLIGLIVLCICCKCCCSVYERF